MMTMSDGRLKALACQWVKSSVAGDAEAVRAMFHPDCRLLIVGDMPFCGWMNVDAFFRQTMVLPLAGPIRFEVGEMVEEGERVWFEAQSSAQLVGGGAYRNVYIFQMVIRDELIVEYKEFGDTLHAWRMIDAPETRGPPIERVPLFTQPSLRVEGKAIGETERQAEG